MSVEIREEAVAVHSSILCRSSYLVKMMTTEIGQFTCKLPLLTDKRRLSIPVLVASSATALTWLGKPSLRHCCSALLGCTLRNALIGVIWWHWTWWMHDIIRRLRLYNAAILTTLIKTLPKITNCKFQAYDAYSLQITGLKIRRLTEIGIANSKIVSAQDKRDECDEIETSKGDRSRKRVITSILSRWADLQVQNVQIYMVMWIDSRLVNGFALKFRIIFGLWCCRSIW